MKTYKASFAKILNLNLELCSNLVAQLKLQWQGMKTVLELVKHGSMEVRMKQEAPAEPPSPASVVEPLHEPEEMEMVELEVDNDNETDTHLQQLQEEVKVKLEKLSKDGCLTMSTTATEMECLGYK